MPETVEKRFREVGDAVISRQNNRDTGKLWLERCDQVLIAAISGTAPKIVIIRLRL